MQCLPCLIARYPTSHPLCSFAGVTPLSGLLKATVWLAAVGMKPVGGVGGRLCLIFWAASVGFISSSALAHL